MRAWRAALAALAVAAVVAGTAADVPGAVRPAPSAPFEPGEPGIGDPYFSAYGNGGYDVGHYRLELRYDPASGQLDGHAVISATATRNLSRFDLDFGGLALAGLTVDGAPAGWRVGPGQELVVVPGRGLRRGHGFTVDVRYHGVPGTGPADTGVHNGFLRSAGGALAVGEPEVS